MTDSRDLIKREAIVKTDVNLAITSSQRLELNHQKLQVSMSQLCLAVQEADESVEALELLLEGKRSPTFKVNEFGKKLIDAKKKLEAIKKAYSKLEKSLTAEAVQALLESQE